MMSTRNLKKTNFVNISRNQNFKKNVVFQITLTYVRAILKNVKIDLGLFFPNCPQSHAITSTN